MEFAPEHSDRPAIEALEIRRRFEDPPYGWDGGAVQVALALLLRMGTCKLVIDGHPVTDPQDPDANLALTRDQRFRQLRVYGVRSDLDPQQVINARGFYETLFGDRPALVPATLHNALGDRMAAVHARCAALQQWATATSFPLPPALSVGLSVLDELIASATPVARLPLFIERHAHVLALLELLEALEQFRTRSGPTFQQVRDYFTSMINTSLDVPQLQTFLRSFNALQYERCFTDAPRWANVIREREAAESAVTTWLTQARDAIHQQVAERSARLPADLVAVGANEVQVAEYASRLNQPFAELLTELAAQPTVATMHMAGPKLAMLELNLKGELERLRAQFTPTPSMIVPVKVESSVQLRDYVSDAPITTIEELDAALATLRAKIVAALGNHG